MGGLGDFTAFVLYKLALLSFALKVLSYGFAAGCAARLCLAGP
jgi:hypothetical protein